MPALQQLPDMGRRPHLAGRGMCCTVNPALTVERAMEIRPAGQRKTVTIVGGGLAGMSAAATLGERGTESFCTK